MTEQAAPPSCLYAALAKAQAALIAPVKNREVTVKPRDKPSYKFKYTTLDALIEHIRKPLTDNGLWFVQLTEPGAMVTRIVHASGESMDSSVPMPNIPDKPQDAGSLLTYFRRYSLACALGLASDEDDDANVAEGNGYEPRDRTPKPMSDDDYQRLIATIDATESDAQKLLAACGIASKELRDLTYAEYAKCMAALDVKMKRAAHKDAI